MLFVVLFSLTSAGAADTTPAVLVFENARYQQQLQATIGSSSGLELVDCAAPGSCNPPDADIAERVVAVVASLPRNTNIFPELPKLKLFQSSFYISPANSLIQPETVGISIYYPDYKNRSSIEDGVDPMGEWAVLAILQWRWRLAEKEATFRQCAFEADAPLGCPVYSDLTTHRPMWRSKTTIGVMGFGSVGRAMTDFFAAMQWDVIATDINGPFTPLPKGLSWFGNDNDYLLAHADFVIVAVPETLTNIINATSLGLMKPDAVLIPLDPVNIDYAALYDALVGGHIGGAILDVEPDGCWGLSQMCGPPYGPSTQPFASLKGKAFQDLPNVHITPNVMMQTEQFWDNSAAYCGANLLALMAGRPLQNMVRNITSVSTLK